ncbi:hypothetical protein BYT27DRAFT_7093771 [Phlegmacium glaucopus]|nr:hypothetical protein BYT27DRAFT_7093771 [Phlegmacium glaucopus]
MIPTPIVDRFSPQEEGVETVKGEVLDFWEKCIGNESESVQGAYLCTQLSSFLGIELDAVASQRLLLHLDHDNTGYVGLSTLHDLVQNGDMKEVINTYSADPTLPLLIWIDDDMFANEEQALDACQAGITVVQIGSTFAAKRWIRINREFLKKHDNPADIRFVSDQVRNEFSPEGVMFKNYSAGEEMTKFIREEGFLAPLLIYTGARHLYLTHYVDAYKMVGSSVDDRVFERYASALGARRNDDTQWVRYGGS